MNRFSAQLDKLDTLPTKDDDRFWYRTAILDVRIALGNVDVSNEQWPLIKEVLEALQKRYQEAVN